MLPIEVYESLVKSNILHPMPENLDLSLNEKAVLGLIKSCQPQESDNVYISHRMIGYVFGHSFSKTGKIMSGLKRLGFVTEGETAYGETGYKCNI